MFANLIYKGIESGIRILESAKEVIEFINETYEALRKNTNGSCIILENQLELELEESKPLEFGPSNADFEANDIRNIVSGISKAS